jgi:hypothetical protein
MTPTVPFPPPPWRQYLDTLPEAEAPDTLWPRLAAAQRQAQRRRQRPFRLGAAAAVLALVALFAAQRLPAPTSPAVAGAPGLGHVAQPAADPGLRRLDDQIALAYARGADEDEVAVLWQARAQVLASLEGPAPVVLARL